MSDPKFSAAQEAYEAAFERAQERAEDVDEAERDLNELTASEESALELDDRENQNPEEP